MEQSRELNVSFVIKVIEISFLFNKHKKISHDGLRFKCDKCDISLKSKETLKRHYNQKHSTTITESNHKCSQCKKEFNQRTSLTRHFESIHNGKKFKCDRCESELSCYSHLKRHQKTVHVNKKMESFPINNGKSKDLRRMTDSYSSESKYFKEKQNRIKRGTWIVKLKRLEMSEPTSIT